MKYKYRYEEGEPNSLIECRLCQSVVPVREIGPEQDIDFQFLCELCENTFASTWAKSVVRGKGMNMEMEVLSRTAILVCQVGNIIIDKITGRKPQ
jgi:phosphoribulokinase